MKTKKRRSAFSEEAARERGKGTTNQTIECPYCKKSILLNEAITHKIRERLSKEFEIKMKEEEEELRSKERTLSSKEKELESAKETLEKTITHRINQERKKIEKDAKEKANEEISLEIIDLQNKLAEKDKRLEEAQNAELTLRQRSREIEEKEKKFDLELARKVDEQTQKIREEIAKSVAEGYRFKELEKEKQIEDMRKQIDELKAKAEQGSQQLQGEVAEIELEDVLKTKFPLDTIEPVPKGIRGADVTQKIHNSYGVFCGTIIWESKRTKTWNNDWITKLKDDQREFKAEIAVLTTTVLPKDVTNFAYIDGVWVTDFASMISLATALRITLNEIALTKMAAVGKYDKMEVLYNYLSGLEFKQRVEVIVEAFASMKRDLDQEKRAMTKIWSKREKQIERVVNNTVGMCGDMQGIIGASMPQIESLELKALEAGTDFDETKDENEEEHQNDSGNR